MSENASGIIYTFISVIIPFLSPQTLARTQVDYTFHAENYYFIKHVT
jgi:hypothetical protein